MTYYRGILFDCEGKSFWWGGEFFNPRPPPSYTLLIYSIFYRVFLVDTE
jgi:hypothetical protein